MVIANASSVNFLHVQRRWTEISLWNPRIGRILVWTVPPESGREVILFLTLSGRVVDNQHSLRHLALFGSPDSAIDQKTNPVCPVSNTKTSDVKRANTWIMKKICICIHYTIRRWTKGSRNTKPGMKVLKQREKSFQKEEIRPYVPCWLTFAFTSMQPQSKSPQSSWIKMSFSIA
jgi:hypothetical protein